MSIPTENGEQEDHVVSSGEAQPLQPFYAEREAEEPSYPVRPSDFLRKPSRSDQPIDRDERTGLVSDILPPSEV